MAPVPPATKIRIWSSVAPDPGYGLVAISASCSTQPSHEPPTSPGCAITRPAAAGATLGRCTPRNPADHVGAGPLPLGCDRDRRAQAVPRSGAAPGQTVAALDRRESPAPSGAG